MSQFMSLSIFCLLLVVFSFPSSSSSACVIEDACKASRGPPACEAWLSSSSDPNHVPVINTTLQVIQLALNLTTRDLHKGWGLIQQIYDDASKSNNRNRSNVALTCKEFLNYSTYRVDLAGQALTNRHRIKEARAFMSAVLLYEYDCWSALKYVNDTSLVVTTMDFFNSTLIQGSSSALGMMVNYDIHGAKTKLWAPPKTERDGFWEDSSSSRSKPKSSWVSRIPDGLKTSVTVCQRGKKCDYRTVQDAVNAAPSNLTGTRKWFVILIKEGVYEETVRIPLEKTNVVFLGDGMGKTVITGSRNAQQLGMSTYNSATLGVAGDRFMASNLTIRNTARSDEHQAVAFRSDSDQSVLENCEIIGNQDTLYAHSLRQYYSCCRIQGNVDFIFGNSAALFQGCQILVAERQPLSPKGERNAVTAQGRTDPAQSTGFVFQDSVINGTKAYLDLFKKNHTMHRTFLGRPWKEYSRTVIIRCTLEALIAKEGWMAWKDGSDFALSTLYYGEFNNTGPGSSTSERVLWSSQIPDDHVQSYSLLNFIQAASY